MQISYSNNIYDFLYVQNDLKKDKNEEILKSEIYDNEFGYKLDDIYYIDKGINNLMIEVMK